MVAVEGGNEGVGVLVRLWEEPADDGDEEDEEESRDSMEGTRESGNGSDQEEDMRMMAEVHWCFRRQDLPGIMKNLSVEDVCSSSFSTDLMMGLIMRRTRCYSLHRPFDR
jgi:origin recognition complex subunit 1